MDFWHANDGEYLAHTRYLDEFEGPVFGGHIAQINWTAPDDEVWLEERRDIRSWLHSDDSYIVDLSIEMYAIAGLIRLDGDLQHAGVQFRAAQYVADNRENTRFIRPADWADYPQDYELAEGERENMPWNAMQFEIEETIPAELRRCRRDYTDVLVNFSPISSRKEPLYLSTTGFG